MMLKKLWQVFLLVVVALFLIVFAACTPNPDLSENPANLPDQDMTGTEGQEESAPDPMEMTCTLRIRCDTLLDNLDHLAEGKAELVPSDGLLLEADDVTFSEGESVFDVLKRELQARRMHLEFSESAVYGTVYIEGICNLYEYDCGELSGWIYRVNGETSSCGCSDYLLKDGDVIEWLYTCDLGDDL